LILKRRRLSDILDVERNRECSFELAPTDANQCDVERRKGGAVTKPLTSTNDGAEKI
jgi:hypothetical protein